MSITLDFILLFVLLIIPGLAFKRFFFYGDFSKQFTTKETIYQSIFYSIIPGILVQLMCIWAYVMWFSADFKNDEVLSIFRNIFNTQDTKLNKETISFLNENFKAFICFEGIVISVSCCLGFSLFIMVRSMGLDHRFKFLRFRNTWYYIFSGEIHSFPKFKKSKRNLNPFRKQIKEKYDLHYADVLVCSGGSHKLYSGYLTDYDLNYEKPGELEKYISPSHTAGVIRKKVRN